MVEDRLRPDLAVIGLGYIGLSLAVEAARVGLRVVGLDVDRDHVGSLRAGHSHVVDVSDAELAEALRLGLAVTEDPDGLREAEAFLICVPTPLKDGVPDLTLVVTAAETLARHLRPGCLVVLESSTYPGTTEEVVRPILEAGSGLRGGADFHLAYSPERIDPGNPTWTLRTTPKIVGGVDPASTARAFDLYQKLCDQVVVASGTREAELAKLLENTYRHVNIALVNELAILAHELGVDIWEVIELAATKPFGFQPFYPGPGVGGHCIPVDPQYLSHLIRTIGRQFRLVELAQDVNDQMPAYVVHRATGILNRAGRPVNGSSILLLGVAYKAGVSDLRETPALVIAGRLQEMGAVLSYWDPYVPRFEVNGSGIARVDEPVAAARAAHLVLLLTAHPQLDLSAVAEAAPAMLDTRGVVPRGLAERL